MSSTTDIMKRLTDKINKEPYFKECLENSLTLAVRAAPEFAAYKISTLDEYIQYMKSFLNWVPTENSQSTEVLIRICMFYFVLDMPPVRDWQNSIHPSQRAPWLWLSKWIIDYAKEMGLWMDKPASLTAQSLETFKKSPKYRVSDYKDDGWNTFNKFFARKFNNIDIQRPIASPNDDKVIVNPADCKYDGEWQIGDGTPSINAKGIDWPISELLSDTKWEKDFAGGKFTHSFLSPTDYHRMHAPVSGKVVEAKVIPGLCYLEVILQRDPSSAEGAVKLGMRRFMSHEKHIPEKYRAVPLEEVLATRPADPPVAAPTAEMVAPDSTGYQFLQARGLVLIDNPVLGLVAVLPIGMAQVSSVRLSVKTGDTVKKGDEIAYFQMGGSDIVMVFQKKANVIFVNQVGAKLNVRARTATGGGK